MGGKGRKQPGVLRRLLPKVPGIMLSMMVIYIPCLGSFPRLSHLFTLHLRSFLIPYPAERPQASGESRGETRSMRDEPKANDARRR